jgi:hypothetical protein
MQRAATIDMVTQAPSRDTYRHDRVAFLWTLTHLQRQPHLFPHLQTVRIRGTQFIFIHHRYVTVNKAKCRQISLPALYLINYVIAEKLKVCVGLDKLTSIFIDHFFDRIRAHTNHVTTVFVIAVCFREEQTIRCISFP